MAVVEVTELIPERSARAGLNGAREYVRSFHVLTDDVDDGPEVARLATGVPRILDVYGDNPDAVVQGLEVTQVSEYPLLWKVVSTYSTPTGQFNEEENPLERPADIQHSFATSQEVLTSSLDNNTACLNTANDPFDPPIMRDVSHPVIRVTRNEAAYSIATSMAYVNHVNSTAFLGASPNTWLMRDISATYVVEGVYTYWRVAYELQYNPLEIGGFVVGWQAAVLNAGFTGYIEDPPSSGTYVKKTLVDKDGTPYNVPQLLDANGRKIAAPTPANAIYRYFVRYLSANFNNLNLL